MGPDPLAIDHPPAAADIAGAIVEPDVLCILANLDPLSGSQNLFAEASGSPALDR
jgi:hypothetical protein